VSHERRKIHLSQHYPFALSAATYVPIIARVHAEEDFLVREFGEQDRAYQ